MDSKYIITPDGNFATVDELYHHGTKGMKWGVRRYQNPDGSLTAAGRKRYTNPDGSLNEKGKKKFGNSVKTAESAGSASKSSSRESASTMTDAELQTRVNRLRNEDAYRDLSKKLGYDSPNTELAAKIAEMEQQKKYLELQRDIKNLTPKKVSAGKKLVDGLVEKVIAPAATEASKKVLAQYLTEAGMNAIGKTAKKETEKIKKTVDESSERVKNKQAKEEAKAAEKMAKQEAKAAEKEAKKEAKQQAKTESKDNKTYEGTVEGEGTSKSSIKNDKQKGPIIDVQDYTESYSNTPVTSLTTTKNTSSGSSMISRYSNTPISGLLPAPKDDDD